MWIPTPSMTLPQRMVLYGTCAVALVNSVGLLVLMVQQNQQRAWLEQTEARLTEVEQSSVVEFFQELPRGAAGLRAGPGDYSQSQQYSRNKRSEGLEKDLQQEHRREEEKELQLKEASQEVLEEKVELKHDLKQKHRHSHHYKTQDEMMMMMTYSMVPVRGLPTFKCLEMFISFYFY